jgi:hypothetical protein
LSLFFYLSRLQPSKIHLLSLSLSLSLCSPFECWLDVLLLFRVFKLVCGTHTFREMSVSLSLSLSLSLSHSLILCRVFLCIKYVMLKYHMRCVSQLWFRYVPNVCVCYEHCRYLWQ